MKEISRIITNLVGDIFIQGATVDEITLDFWIPRLNKGILLFEVEHDHPDAYYGRSMEVQRLKEAGKDVLLLWLESSSKEWIRENCSDKIQQFLNENS